MNEFSLINHYFKSIPIKRKEVLLGIGDDAASLDIPPDMEFLVSTDTLVSGIHFLPQWNPYDIACKAVMVNVSDMAAMAAEPCWITLALTLPNPDKDWLLSFSKGLQDSLSAYQMDLIGGDTTKGPLSITITIMGLAPKGQSVKRSGAKIGDSIWVSGELGASALMVKWLDYKDLEKSLKDQLMTKLLHPKPRVDLKSLLRTFANSAIDISDGLSADLNHICEESQVGACINQKAIPISSLVTKNAGKEALDLALFGGDDYELCFTVSESNTDEFLNELKKSNIICYPIGHIEKEPGLRIVRENKACEELPPKGYSHF